MLYKQFWDVQNTFLLYQAASVAFVYMQLFLFQPPFRFYENGYPCLR
jgi:hypothetical protein